MHNHKRILCLSLAGMMVLGTPTHSFAANNIDQYDYHAYENQQWKFEVID